MGNSSEISSLSGTQIMYLKQEKKEKAPKQLNPTLKSLVLRPMCVFEGA